MTYIESVKDQGCLAYERRDSLVVWKYKCLIYNGKNAVML